MEIFGRSFCYTPLDRTSFNVEYSCSLSRTIGHLLKIGLFIIIVALSQKLANDSRDHAWMYPPSMTKKRISSVPCSSLTVILSYPISTKPTYATLSMKAIWRHLFYSDPKLMQALFVLRPCSRIQHLMRDSDVSESLKIRTSLSHLQTCQGCPDPICKP